MQAMDSTILKDGICNDCNCNDFEAKLNYDVDTQNKKVKVTDASVFDSGDDLKTAIVHVYDKDGNEKHGHIDTKGGSVEIEAGDLVLNGISITATVVSQQGLKSNLGIYNIGSTSYTGELGNKTK